MNLENAKNTLKKFIMAMNHWEVHYYPLVKNDLSNDVRLKMINNLNFVQKKNENMVGKFH
ncbi:MAG: hypothetical protein J6572_11095 [Gilliamella sp.]|nr:hypothetical protein [Gilliamella sp.]